MPAKQDEQTAPPDRGPEPPPLHGAESTSLPKKHKRKVRSSYLREMNPTKFAADFRKVVKRTESALNDQYTPFHFGPERIKRKNVSQTPGTSTWREEHEYKGSYRSGKNVGFDVSLSYEFRGNVKLMHFEPSRGGHDISFVVTAPDNPLIGCFTAILLIPCVLGAMALFSSGGTSGIGSLLFGVIGGILVAGGLAFGLARVFSGANTKKAAQQGRTLALAAFTILKHMAEDFESLEAAPALTTYEPREWTSTKSGKPVCGSFLRTDAEYIYLKKSDGTLSKLAKSTLTATDEAYLMSINQ